MGGLTGFLRVVVSFGWLALLGGGAWFGYHYLNRDAERAQKLAESQLKLEEAEVELVARATQISGLREDVQQKAQEIETQALEIETQALEIETQALEIEHLDLSMKLLKVTKRVAQVAVLGKSGDAADGSLVTRLRFVEVGEDGEPVAESRTFSIEGDLLYVDAWVVKFDDALVESAEDPLRSASLCVFRRMFGEHQKPSEGAVLDTPSQRPEVYGGEGLVGGLEGQIWSNFWELANDPSKARELGIRSIHGEAPSMKLQKGKVYKLTLRASGGLEFEALDLPAVMVD